jgi:hypothetical protein
MSRAAKKQNYNDVIKLMRLMEKTSSIINKKILEDGSKLTEKQLYSFVKKAFTNTNYTMTIYQSKNNGRTLTVQEIFIANNIIKQISIFGKIISKIVPFDGFSFQVKKDGIYDQVLKGKTLKHNFKEIITEFASRILSKSLWSKVQNIIDKTKINIEQEESILTPIKVYNRVIGILGIHTSNMSELLIDSVKIFSKNISDALELIQNLKKQKQNENKEAKLRKYTTFRAKMFEIALQSKHIDQLKINLFKAVGRVVNPTRICYFELNEKQDCINTYEWVKKGQKASWKGAKFPQSLWKNLQHNTFLQFTPESITNLLTAHPLFSLAKPIIKKIIQIEGTKSMIAFPLKVNNQFDGVITFDWCEEGTRLWTEYEIGIGRDMVHILSTNISKIRAEENLSIQNSYNQLRAEMWKLAYNKHLKENRLIEKMLKLGGNTRDVHRVSYSK